MQDLISRNSSRLELAMRLVDVALLILAGEAAGYAVFHAPLAEAAPVHALLLVSCPGLAFLLFPQFGLTLSWRGRPLPAMLLPLAGAWGASLLLGLLFAVLSHHVAGLSRLWLLLWFGMGLGLLAAARLGLHGALRALRRQGFNSKRVLIVGYGPAGQELHRRAGREDWAGYDVVAVHACAQEPWPPQPGLRRLARLDELPACLAEQDIAEVWITLPLSAAAELRQLQHLLADTLVDVRWIPDTLSMRMLSSRLIDFLGFPAVDLNRPRAAGAGGLAKDLFDRCFALAVIVLAAPLFVALAVGVKLSSPGPVLYAQPRLGLNGRPFRLLKFRSMRLDQDRGFVQATRDDPRVTPFGRFLRRTSLDELPQFFNVLMGDMSVVGPRPHAIPHNEQFRKLISPYMLRHRVKPGITGWAQIHGYRGETDTLDKMAMRVQLDLHYIRHWSLWMDLRIIAWTALRGWSGKNAY